MKKSIKIKTMNLQKSEHNNKSEDNDEKESSGYECQLPPVPWIQRFQRYMNNLTEKILGEEEEYMR
jgi:hypothetical protein